MDPFRNLDGLRDGLSHVVIVDSIVNPSAQLTGEPSGPTVLALVGAVQEQFAQLIWQTRPVIKASTQSDCRPHRLIQTRKEDGLWHDDTLSAVVLARLDYLRYSFIQAMMPLHALGFYDRVIDLLRGKDKLRTA